MQRALSVSPRASMSRMDYPPQYAPDTQTHSADDVTLIWLCFSIIWRSERSASSFSFSNLSRIFLFIPTRTHYHTLPAPFLQPPFSWTRVSQFPLNYLPPPATGRLPAAHQFRVSLKKEGCTSLATWHVQIPGKILTELSVRRFDHQETGGDLEGARVPAGWGGLMPMYSRLTSVSTQLGGRPTIMFSGDVSSTRQHSIRGTPLKNLPQKTASVTRSGVTLKPAAST